MSWYQAHCSRCAWMGQRHESIWEAAREQRDHTISAHGTRAMLANVFRRNGNPMRRHWEFTS